MPARTAKKAKEKRSNHNRKLVFPDDFQTIPEWFEFGRVVVRQPERGEPHHGHDAFYDSQMEYLNLAANHVQALAEVLWKVNEVAFHRLAWMTPRCRESRFVEAARGHLAEALDCLSQAGTAQYYADDYWERVYPEVSDRS